MMDKKQFEALMKSLKNIENKLDIIIRIQKMASSKPKIGPEEKKILKLCDKKHTIAEIITETKKSKNNVKSTLSHLRKKTLIRSVKVNKRLVYEKI